MPAAAATFRQRQTTDCEEREPKAGRFAFSDGPSRDHSDARDGSAAQRCTRTHGRRAGMGFFSRQQRVAEHDSDDDDDDFDRSFSYPLFPASEDAPVDPRDDGPSRSVAAAVDLPAHVAPVGDACDESPVASEMTSATADSSADADPSSRQVSEPAADDRRSRPVKRLVAAKKTPVFENDERLSSDEFLCDLRRTGHSRRSDAQGSAVSARNADSKKRSTHSVGSQKRYLEHDLSSYYSGASRNSSAGRSVDRLRADGYNRQPNHGSQPHVSNVTGTTAPTSTSPDNPAATPTDLIASLDSTDDHNRNDKHSSGIPPSTSTDPSSGGLPAAFSNHRLVRRTVFGLLAVVALLSSSLVYWHARQTELTYFEIDYQHASDVILDNYMTRWQLALGAMESAQAYVFNTLPDNADTDYNGIDTNADTNATPTPNSQWPFLLLPDFQRQASDIQHQGNFTFFAVLPLLQNEAERIPWERFSTEYAPEWIQNNGDGGDKDRPVSPGIYELGQDDDEILVQPPDSGPYLVVWQHSPTDTSLVNYNIRTSPTMNPDISNALRSRTVLVSAMSVESIDSDYQQISSMMYFPLLQNSDASSTTMAKTLRGTLLASIEWKHFFHPFRYTANAFYDSNSNNRVDVYEQASLLPETANGIQAVVRNSCQQAVTFEVRNQRMQVVDSQRDIHDDKYNDHEQAIRDVPFNEDYECTYSVHIYPTTTFVDRYTTMMPWIYALVVATICLVSVSVVVAYDALLRRQRQMLVTTALRSHAIVSSVLPKNVQERLLQDDATAVEGNSRRALPTRQSSSSDVKRRRSGSVRSFRSRLTNASRHSGSNGDDGYSTDGGLTTQLEEQKSRLERFMSAHSVSYDGDEEGTDDEDFNRSYNSFAIDTIASSSTMMFQSPKPSSMDTTTSVSASQHSRATKSRSSIRIDKTSSPKADQPKAQRFPETTILFADICGFTDWSSTRDPSDVFTLLEAVYCAFDTIAVKRKVYKVETVGDCYVAATGLPQPQQDHAVIMARFAGDILNRIEEVCETLEGKLGPDVSDLSVRVGMHSGPVVGGMLQHGGNKDQVSRFQLFGDTVNMASRMETCGRVNQIHCSKETADLLVAAGKGDWLKLRDGLVAVKGKGSMQTFWVTPKRSRRLSGGSIDDFQDHSEVSETFSRALSSSEVVIGPPGEAIVRSPNFQRLIDWNVELLSQQLKRILAKRQQVAASASLSESSSNQKSTSVSSFPPDKLGNWSNSNNSILDPNSDGGGTLIGKSIMQWGNPRNEYTDSISFDASYVGGDGSNNDGSAMNGTNQPINPDRIELENNVDEQLRAYVMKMACSYQSNPFHCFDHACHATMSVHKILKRVSAQESRRDNECAEEGDTDDGSVSRYRRRILSDPLTHFACLFAALVHDVDHPGVPNGQLVREHDEMATLYGNRSVAEQNSIDLAWGLLMDSTYSDLRRCLFADDGEKKRFRQLLVNLVIATDIFDAELKTGRESRWQQQFGATGNGDDNTKATMVLEYILQAADISHTMQHWPVYKKWNKRLYQEMHAAFRGGRLASDPTPGWYNGEIWFFDNYVIPLATKLSESRLFGDSSDEFLKNAKANRAEWQKKGKEIVKQMRKEMGDEADKSKV